MSQAMQRCGWLSLACWRASPTTEVAYTLPVALEACMLGRHRDSDAVSDQPSGRRNCPVVYDDSGLAGNANV